VLHTKQIAYFCATAGGYNVVSLNIVSNVLLPIAHGRQVSGAREYSGCGRVAKRVGRRSMQHSKNAGFAGFFARFRNFRPAILT
jgi:hypothetical protein